MRIYCTVPRFAWTTINETHRARLPSAQGARRSQPLTFCDLMGSCNCLGLIVLCGERLTEEVKSGGLLVREELEGVSAFGDGLAGAGVSHTAASCRRGNFQTFSQCSFRPPHFLINCSHCTLTRGGENLLVGTGFGGVVAADSSLARQPTNSSHNGWRDSRRDFERISKAHFEVNGDVRIHGPSAATLL